MNCPEELLDHRATLDDAERRALEAHLAECPACALQIALATAPPMDVDAARIARAVDGAMTKLAPRPRTSRLRWGVGVGIAAALLAFGAFAATRSTHEQPVASEPPRVVLPHAVETPVQIAPEPQPETAVSIEDLPRAQAQVSVPVQTHTELSQAPAITMSAAELFARANAARRLGDTSEALRVYRELVREFPQSNEAAIAHVSAARLLETADAQGALAEYDAYLADARNVDLREEALGGRAGTLERLGRRDEERAAWQELLSKYPDSLRASHARKRVGSSP